MGLIAFELARETAKVLLVQLDTVSPASKLEQIQAKINSASPEEAINLMV